MRCSECGREIPDDSLFCPECGKQQTIGQKPQKEKMKRCTNCGCKIPEDSAFCPECGKRVEKEVVHDAVADSARHHGDHAALRLFGHHIDAVHELVEAAAGGSQHKEGYKVPVRSNSWTS